jgi:hypothetical protein
MDEGVILLAIPIPIVKYVGGLKILLSFDEFRKSINQLFMGEEQQTLVHQAVVDLTLDGKRADDDIAAFNFVTSLPGGFHNGSVLTKLSLFKNGSKIYGGLSNSDSNEYKDNKNQPPIPYVGPDVVGHDPSSFNSSKRVG